MGQGFSEGTSSAMERDPIRIYPEDYSVNADDPRDFGDEQVYIRDEGDDIYNQPQTETQSTTTSTHNQPQTETQSTNVLGRYSRGCESLLCCASPFLLNDSQNFSRSDDGVSTDDESMRCLCGQIRLSLHSVRELGLTGKKLHCERCRPPVYIFRCDLCQMYFYTSTEDPCIPGFDGDKFCQKCQIINQDQCCDRLFSRDQSLQNHVLMS